MPDGVKGCKQAASETLARAEYSLSCLQDRTHEAGRRLKAKDCNSSACFTASEFRVDGINFLPAIIIFWWRRSTPRLGA